MKEELVSGLKNAVERGSSLESAVASFINAGYNATDVNEAASMISQGAINLMPAKPQPSAQPVSQSLSSTKIEPALQEKTFDSPVEVSKKGLPNNLPDLKPASQVVASVQLKKVPPKKHTALIVTLVIVLLLIATGIAALMIYKDQVISFLTNKP